MLETGAKSKTLAAKRSANRESIFISFIFRLALIFVGVMGAVLLPRQVLGQCDNLESLVVAKKLSQAVDCLRGIQESTTNEFYALAMGVLDRSGESSISNLKDFVGNRQTSDNTSDWAIMYIGKYYMSNNLYQAAAGQFKQISSESPFMVEARYLSGMASALAGDLREAEEFFKSLTRRKNETFRNQADTIYKNLAALGLAEIRLNSGRYSEAEKMLKQILETNPDDEVGSLVLIDLMEVYEKTGKAGDLAKTKEFYLQQYGTLPEADSVDSIALESRNDTLRTVANNIVGNKYYICVGFYPKKSDAEKLAAMYRKRGYNARVETHSENKEITYMVLVGSYQSKSQALHVKQTLEKSARETYSIIIR